MGTESQTDLPENGQREWEPRLHLSVSPGCHDVSHMTWNGLDRIAIIGRYRAIHIHDFDSSLNGRIPLDFEPSAIAFVKTDYLVVSALNGRVEVMRLFKNFAHKSNPAQSRRHNSAHNAPIFALDVNADGSHFISAGADKVVKLWTVSGHKLLSQFHKHTNAVRHLRFRADGQGFASAGDDREIIEWDVRCPNPTGAIGWQCGGGASALAYLPEGHLVVGHRDNNLRIFDRRTKKAFATYLIGNSPVRSLSLHQSGQFIAAASPKDQSVSVIDLLNGVPLTTFTLKLAVQDAVFLSPSEPAPDDFDTSDMLCIPGRGNKLDIFDCDLTRLLKEDDAARTLVEDPSPDVDIPEKPSLNAEPGKPVGSVRFEQPRQNETPSDPSGEELISRRAKRMSMMRRSVHPKKFAMDDIPEAGDPPLTESNGNAPVEPETEGNLQNGSVSLEVVSAQVATLTGMVASLTRTLSSIEAKFGEMDERLKKIERHCLQDDTEKCLLGSCKESPAAEG